LDAELLEISRWIAAKSGRDSDARGLARMLQRSSVILAEEDGVLKAVEFLSEARRIWEQRFDWSDLDSVDGLAGCLELLAKANLRLRRLQRALSCARRASDLYAEVVRLTAAIEAKQELASSFELLGQCQLALRKDRAGGASIERGIELLRGVAEQTGQSEDLLALAESLKQAEERLAVLQSSIPRITKRGRLLKEWRSVLEALRPRLERCEWAEQLLRWKDRSARVLLAKNEHREAYKCFESCRKGSKNDWLRTRETWALNNFVWYSQMCASCLGHLGEPRRAQARLSQLKGFLELLRERAAGDPSYLSTIEECDRVYELACRSARKRR
jgi:tetratricopeptide (TPR) repeat protein